MPNVRMPVLFVGHGSPMNAIEDNEFSRTWAEIAQGLPRPEAILCVSAHWETQGVKVTAMEKPRTIYDFYGFPQPLYDKKYAAPGAPNLVKPIQDLLAPIAVQADMSWGLDHGAWSVLCRMYPQADIPVAQLSLDRSRDAAAHYELGRLLAPLRDEGVLIVSSGNIVHNLRLVVFEDTAFDWALQFDQQVKNWILKADHCPIIQFEKQGKAAQLAVNSGEHYLPLLYTLGAATEDEPVQFFTEKVWGGSLSMRCVKIG